MADSGLATVSSTDLPGHLHAAILHRLAPRDVVKAAQVSKSWRNMAAKVLSEKLGCDVSGAFDAAWLIFGLPKVVKPERVKASLPLRSLLVHAYGRSGLGQHVQASDLTHSTGLGEAMQAAIDSDPEFITLLRMGWKSHWPEPPGVAAGEFHDSRISVSEQHLDDHSELVLAVSLDTELFAALHLSPLGAVDNSRAAASGSRENLSSKATPGWQLLSASLTAGAPAPPIVAFWLRKVAEANRARRDILSRIRCCSLVGPNGNRRASRADRAIAALGCSFLELPGSKEGPTAASVQPPPGPAAMLVRFPFRKTRRTAGSAIERALPAAKELARLLLAHRELVAVMRHDNAKEQAFNQAAVASVCDRRIGAVLREASGL